MDENKYTPLHKATPDEGKEMMSRILGNAEEYGLSVRINREGATVLVLPQPFVIALSAVLTYANVQINGTTDYQIDPEKVAEMQATYWDEFAEFDMFNFLPDNEVDTIRRAAWHMAMIVVTKLIMSGMGDPMSVDEFVNEAGTAYDE